MEWDLLSIIHYYLFCKTWYNIVSGIETAGRVADNWFANTYFGCSSFNEQII